MGLTTWKERTSLLHLIIQSGNGKESRFEISILRTIQLKSWKQGKSQVLPGIPYLKLMLASSLGLPHSQTPSTNWPGEGEPGGFSIKMLTHENNKSAIHLGHMMHPKLKP